MASSENSFYPKLHSFILRLRNTQSVFAHSNFLEKFLMEVQEIITWECPILSSYYIISVNFIFWMFFFSGYYTFYGILFSVLLFIALEQYRADRNLKSSCSVSPSDPPKSSKFKLFTDEEISSGVQKGKKWMRDTYERAKLYRQNEPGRFCILVCSFFFNVYFVGRYISFVLTFYILLMLIMTVPGAICHFLLPYISTSIREGGGNDNDDDVEPYLPQTSPEALKLLNLAGDLHLVKEEDEESNDLLLDLASSRSGDHTDINFQSKHFDGDSSEEEEFAKGLSLTDTFTESKNEEEDEDISDSSAVIKAKALVAGVKTMLTSVGKSERESSSDTDSFELIDEDM